MKLQLAKLQLASLGVVILSLIGCSQPSGTGSAPIPQTPAAQEMADASGSGTGALHEFKPFLEEFPILKRKAAEITNSGSAEMYAMHLHYAGEPDLADVVKKGGEAYRLISMDGGARIATIRRIEKNDQGIMLTLKTFDSLTLYSGGKGELHGAPATITLSLKQWNDFQELLVKASFWSVPTGNQVVGLDGSFQLIEGVNSTRHHLVARWNELPAGFQPLFDFVDKLSNSPGPEFAVPPSLDAKNDLM